MLELVYVRLIPLSSPYYETVVVADVKDLTGKTRSITVCLSGQGGFPSERELTDVHSGYGSGWFDDMDHVEPDHVYQISKDFIEFLELKYARQSD